MSAEKPPRRQGEAGRARSEQVKLRLFPDDALRLGAAAEIAGKTVSDYVIAMLDNGGAVPVPTADESYRQTFVEISKVSAAFAALVARLDESNSELRRQGGTLRQSLGLEAKPVRANWDEIQSAILAHKAAIAANEAASAELREAMGDLRAMSAAAVREMAPIVSRATGAEPAGRTAARPYRP